MTASTSLHSNAFNFLSYVDTGTDPRTGQYTCTISLPTLKANNLCGPDIPLQLRFSPLNPTDSGLGLGWDLQLSQYNPASQVLSLHTGETFKVTGSGLQPAIGEKKLDNFHFFNDGSGVFRVVHKSGLVETLTVGGADGIALPSQMRTAQGHRVDLTYSNYGDGRLLKSINNADGTPLLSLERLDNVRLLLHPGSLDEALFTMRLLLDRRVTSIELPTDDKASWRFRYLPQPEGGLRIIEVQTPVGGVETITYAETPHYFPGVEGRTLARVDTHRNDPGFCQPIIETRYTYSKDHHNFLGYGGNVVWRDDGLDNLYRARDNYLYSSIESLWDINSDSAIRSISRTFNRFHLLTVEETTQNDNVLLNETVYHLLAGKEFEHQPAYCQLPKSATQTWYSRKNPSHKRIEAVHTTYDDFGNLLTQVNANGVTETSCWYKAEGEDGCPPDPQQFVRNLKHKTIDPAPSDYGQAPTLETRYTYTRQSGLTGNGPWLALAGETLVQGTGAQAQELQRTAFSYINEPDNPFKHGRKLKDAVTLNGKTTTTDYTYSKARNARSGEDVLHTVSTLIGFDHYIYDPAQPDIPENWVRKDITLQHKLSTGESLLNRDDTDVEIAYEYDKLSRVTKETVAPGTEYEACRTYTYRLTSAVGQKARQSATDVKGVETISYLDGNNRVIKETRRDADALGGDPKKYRETYRATYNNREQLTSETVIDWERAKDVPLTSLFKYDDWAEQRSVVRPDGVEEHEVTDPITRTTSQWLEGMGKTVTTNNLFDKPDIVERFDLDEQLISEHIYHYDGMGRTAEEYDALGNLTSYEYDAFDRMIKTRLPDGNEVERHYADFSSEDLAVKIMVNGVVLGEQFFDGLNRMIRSITGGRESIYTFDRGQSQPKSVKRPSGVKTGYVYRPELGEDPEQRIAVESTAIYTYDVENARLRKTEEVDPSGIKHSLAREYFSNGELRSETREQTGEVSRVMFYEYSRQARLMSYTDVLGQTQQYEYDDFARLIATELSSTRSTFAYNDLGQLETIETIDGSQWLKIDLEYDDFGREVLRKFHLGNGIIQVLSQIYDEVDRLIQRTLEQDTETLRDETYIYDSRGRLVDYSCTGSQRPEDPYGKVIKGQLFGFDAQDNLIFVDTTFEGGLHSITFEYNNEHDPCQLTGLTNELTPARPGDPLYPPRIDFTYNADGNLLRDEEGRFLDYDSLGRLVSVSALPGETANDYLYTSLDTLSGSQSGGTQSQRFYQENKLANQIQGANSTTIMQANKIALAELKEGVFPKS